MSLGLVFEYLYPVVPAIALIGYGAVDNGLEGKRRYA